MDGGVAWMHDNTKKVDLESYLLGKRIDDFVDPTAQENTATDWVRHIFSNFKSKTFFQNFRIFCQNGRFTCKVVAIENVTLPSFLS